MAMTQCLSKRYLNHDILDNDNLGILGYELISVDQPSSKKPGRICIYHKGFFQIKVKHVSYLKGYLNFELSVNGSCVILNWFIVPQINHQMRFTHA